MGIIDSAIVDEFVKLLELAAVFALVEAILPPGVVHSTPIMMFLCSKRYRIVSNHNQETILLPDISDTIVEVVSVSV